MNRNRYWPRSLEIAVKLFPVSALVSRTCAFGTAEHDESVMVPLRVARTSGRNTCQKSRAAPQTASRRHGYGSEPLTLLGLIRDAGIIHRSSQKGLSRP